MKTKAKYFEGLMEAFIWTPILFFSSLLIHNGLLYYRFDLDYGILPEKRVAMKDDLWMICFYIHVLTGILCLMVPVVLFLGRHFKLRRVVHELLGKCYLWSIIFIVVPTGIYLAAYAKGGWWAQVGFVFQGVLLVYYSYLGYKYAKTFPAEHIKYMLRSYALVLSVLTFRILHVIFIVIKIPYEENYAISQWLSITLNLTFAELIIAYIMVRKYVNVPLLKIQI